MPPPRPGDLEAAVIYQDEDLIVLNKPPGLATQVGLSNILPVEIPIGEDILLDFARIL